MISKIPVIVLVIILYLFINVKAQLATPPHSEEKTCFQINAPWQAEYDVRADIAIVYGMSDNFNERVRGWKERGYGIQFMTGIAWGSYQDYFTGKFDHSRAIICDSAFVLVTPRINFV